jgi:hypothetical protein
MDDTPVQLITSPAARVEHQSLEARRQISYRRSQQPLPNDFRRSLTEIDPGTQLGGDQGGGDVFLDRVSFVGEVDPSFATNAQATHEASSLV